MAKEVFCTCTTVNNINSIEKSIDCVLTGASFVYLGSEEGVVVVGSACTSWRYRSTNQWRKLGKDNLEMIDYLFPGRGMRRAVQPQKGVR